MDTYYISSATSTKYIMDNVAIKGGMEINVLKKNIKQIPNFCRGELSIKTSDLIGYLASGITLYVLDVDNNLLGVLNFDVNVDQISILGLCVPKPSLGVGSLLIDVVKKFAEINKIKTIKLTCYGGVVDFYTKPRNGFRIQYERAVAYTSDSDDSDNETPPKIRYDLAYQVIYGGRRTRTKKYVTSRRLTRLKRKSMKNNMRKSRKSRK